MAKKKESEYRILGLFEPIRATQLGKAGKKKPEAQLTKRQKKIGVANLLGTGAGFVVGTGLGGFGGMMLGVPIGTITGNLIGRRLYRKKR